ncbi:hypothetical protein Tco_0849971 [Tanacetum coccineum]
MADLAFVNQNNMVAYLEKSDENAEFHQIVDFFSTCSINYALTVSPTIYTSYIKQFWNTATSKTVNSVKQMHAIVDGKAVVITESSVRNDILFDDEDGITCLANDEFFENLVLMGYEHLSTKLTFQKANIEQILPSPSTYQRKHRKTQKHRRDKKVTKLPQTSVPLDFGADEAIHKEGVTVWKRAITTDASLVAAHDNDNIIRTQTTTMPNVDIPLGMDTEGHTFGSGEGMMEHTFELMDIVPPTPYDLPLPGGYTPGSDEGRLKLEELMAMCIKLSKQVLDLEKEKDGQAVESSDDDLDEEDASKQGRTSDKTKLMFKDSDFDDLDDLVDEEMDFVQEKDAENQGKIGADDTDVVKGSGDTEAFNTAGKGISTTAPRTPPTTTIEEKAKEKGVAIKDVKDSSRPIRSITTLQPFPTIDPKDKGKGILQETELEKPEKVKRRDQGLAQIESDVELAQRLHEEELVELDRAQKEKQKQEEATNAALAK